MPTPTYIPLATTTLGSAASSITFGSIPQGYRDLIVIFNGTASSGSDFRFQFNGDTGSNYAFILAGGASNNTTPSASGSSQTSIPISYTAPLTTTRHVAIAQIMDYSATDKHKTLLARSNNEGSGVSMGAGRWGSNNAITSIRMFPDGNQFSIGSTFSLYGIAG
jgi:hypothetical protein